MNEQIRNIAISACYGERWNSTAEFEKFLDRFAGLIVQECTDIATKQSMRYSELNKMEQAGAAGNVGYLIKDRFGVGSPVRTPVVTITQEEKEALSNWGPLE